MGLNTKQSMWEWFEQPENEWRVQRFTNVMKFDGGLFKDSVWTEAFDWKSLPKGAAVVDVGGNIGVVTLTLFKTFPHLKYVVQDLPKVIPGAQEFWKMLAPEALSNQQVTFQEHDIFQDEPVKGAAVYFMRFILHDWADTECIKILKKLREAANSESRLILFEFSVPYACPDPNANAITGSDFATAPEPLLANYGLGDGAYFTMVDLQMLSLCNGQERTLKGYTDLAIATGWKLEHMKFGRPSSFVFSPV